VRPSSTACQAAAGPDGLGFERVLTLVDGDPHPTLRHTVNYVMAPEEETMDQLHERVLLLDVTKVERASGNRIRFHGGIITFC
jgi:hypothetical protein